MAALDVDWSQSNTFTKTIASSSTFTFSNNADGRTIIIKLTNSTAGALTLTWPASVVGPTTTLSASKVGIYTLVQLGTSVYMTSLEF